MEIFKPVMEEPEVVKCSDGHWRRAIYGLGPYIADYPEQCLLSCIVQGWCPNLLLLLLLLLDVWLIDSTLTLMTHNLSVAVMS